MSKMLKHRTTAIVASLALVTGLAGTSGSAEAAVPPFEAIDLQRIELPGEITNASLPAYTMDGKHLLFTTSYDLYLIGTDGKGLRCLTCGLPDKPAFDTTSEGPALVSPFADGKRLFLAPYGGPTVLECSPSVVQCDDRKILPVDLSGARPGSNGQSTFVSPPGGATIQPAIDLSGGASPKLSPDNKYIAFADIRSDAFELMIIARLTRTDTGYVTSDPRVLNPPGPKSATDPDVDAWSRSSALFEFKTFTNGGADATYVQAGGDSNVDVWQVNLASGKRTRLTSHADWDEDMATSPDGKSMYLATDRTRHRIDMLGNLGMLPVRGFIDSPTVAGAAFYFVGSAERRSCDLQEWLLPGTGDDGAKVLGQPLHPYTGGPVHTANNINGWSLWSPDSTSIALNTKDYTTAKSAPYLEVAHLTGRTPSSPLPVSSSAPGDWAVGPEDYHGAIGSNAAITLKGKASGTADVVYNANGGALAGQFSVTYHDYSDDGRSFANGTTSILNGNLVSGPVRWTSNLTLTGEHNGSTTIDITWGGSRTQTGSGTATTTLDGVTVKDLPTVPKPCPERLQTPAPLAVTKRVVTKRTKRGTRYRQAVVGVTASFAGAGLNQASVDRRPVRGAVVEIGTRRARTNAGGVARIRLPRSNRPGRGRGRKLRLEVRAGDTFRPTRTSIVVG